MIERRRQMAAVVFAATILSAGLAWGLGFELGESKEQLKLEYDVSAKDHGTGRVTVVLTIADVGRLKPLTSVDLVVPGKGTEKDGGDYVDLSVALATEDVGGKQVVRVHLLRKLAERAEIRLKTRSLDGKQHPRTWYYHAIRIADYLKNDARGNE